MHSLSQPASVLVIDDYLLMRKNLQSILTLTGYQVHTTSNVAEAISLLHATEINLIISDMMLPGMDGLSFYRRVRARARWQCIPFIFLSGNIASLESVRAQLASDGVVCLSKPFSVQELLDAVAQMLTPAQAG